MIFSVEPSRQSFTAMRSIAKTLIDVRDFTKLASIQPDLMQRIVDAQGAMLKAQATLRLRCRRPAT